MVKSVSKKKCRICRKKFTTNQPQKIYCNLSCKGKAKRKRHKDYQKKYQQEYRRTSKRKEYNKQYRKNNRDRFNNYNKKYEQSNKGKITRIWDIIRQRIKFYASKKSLPREEMDQLVGCSRIFLLTFLECKFYNNPKTNEKMTWSNTNKWHIDHITPLAKLNPKNDKHLKMANHYCNLQPMWAEENLIKGANIIKGLNINFLKKKYKKIKSFENQVQVSKKNDAKKIAKKVLKAISTIKK